MLGATEVILLFPKPNVQGNMPRGANKAQRGQFTLLRFPFLKNNEPP